MAGGFPGRPPKPTKLKELAGNPGQRPIVDEPEPDSGKESTTTAVPPWLKGEAFAEWVRLAPELFRLGLLTKVDTTYFAAYCEAVGLYHEAMRQVDAEGITVAGATGALVKHPALAVAKDALDAMLKYGTRFGLSPADRARLGGAGIKPDEGDGKGEAGKSPLRLLS